MVTVQEYENFFLRQHQTGGGRDDYIFRAAYPKVQSGGGIGNLIGRFFKFIAPIIAKAVFKSGSQAWTDVVDNKMPLKDVILNRGQEAARDIAYDAVEKHKAQGGTGRRRRRHSPHKQRSFGKAKKQRKTISGFPF